MFFPNRMDLDIINELRILRIAFLVIRKIQTNAIIGKNLCPNIFDLNNLYDVSDKLFSFWFKFLTACVNVKVNQTDFPPILCDEANKYPSLFDKEKGEQSFDEVEEEEAENLKLITKNTVKSASNLIEPKRKSILGKFLQRKSIAFNIKPSKKNEDIMMFTWKSKGNIYKSYLQELAKKEKPFQIPEYTVLAKNLSKTVPKLNCTLFWIFRISNEILKS